MNKQEDLDETVSKMHREADGYEMQIREALEQGKPDHHAPNIRTAWYGQVMHQIHRWIDRHQGRGRRAKRQALAAEAGQHPEWRRLLDRMANHGVLKRNPEVEPGAC